MIDRTCVDRLIGTLLYIATSSPPKITTPSYFLYTRMVKHAFI